MALTDLFALFGIAAVLCASAAALCRVGHDTNPRSPRWFRFLTNAWVLVLFMAMLVPIPGSGLALAGYFRGFVGDLSITFLALSIWSLCHRFLNTVAISHRERKALLVVVCVATLLLYPTALGWGDWDAYRLGWGSGSFLAALLAICGVSAAMGLRVLPALIALAVLAWSSGLMTSDNLWDYLLDPWLSALAWGIVFIKCTQCVFKRFVNTSINRSSH